MINETYETSTGFVVAGPVQINAYRLLALKGALKLESLGMKRRGASALALVRAETGLKAKTAAAMLPLYIAHLRALGVLK